MLKGSTQSGRLSHANNSDTASLAAPDAKPLAAMTMKRGNARVALGLTSAFVNQAVSSQASTKDSVRQSSEKWQTKKPKKNKKGEPPMATSFSNSRPSTSMQKGPAKQGHSKNSEKGRK